MRSLEVPSAHQALEELPIAMVVLRDNCLAYANRAWERLFDLERHTVMGQPAGDLIQATVEVSDQGWVSNLSDTSHFGSQAPSTLWIHVRTAENVKRLMRVVVWRGPSADEKTYAIFDADDEARSRNLTEALARGAARLVQHREEGQLLEAALDVLAAQDLTCNIVFVDGELLVPGPFRQPPALVQAVKEVLAEHGGRLGYDRQFLPHLAELERTRRAAFHQDVGSWIHSVVPSAVQDLIRRAARGSKALDAPLFVGNELLGFLSVQSPELTPSAVAAIELFATHLGAAIENVRHHQHAREQLAEVGRLQAQVIARERLSVLGEAAAVMAHEMQNPLGAILNGVALLKADQPCDRIPVLEIIREEARSLDRLARDLLAYAKPIYADFACLSVGSLFLDAAAQWALSEPAPIDVLPASEDLRVWGDAHLLKIAVSNLLRNALQASPPGARVQVWAAPTATGVRLVVEDRGPGVPEALREQIFEPFFTNRAQGCGLGLALVARVVKAHNGQVRVLDASPVGARFEIELPNPERSCIPGGAEP